MSNSDAGSYVLKAIKTEVLDRGYDTVSNSFMSTSAIAPCGKNNDDEPAVPSSSGPFPREVKVEVKSYECDVPPPKISGTDADESISSPLPNPSNSSAFVTATNRMDDFAHHAAARSNNISADGESVSKMSICPGEYVHAPAVYTEKEHEELQRNATQSPGRYLDDHDNTHDKPGYPDKESSPTAKSEVLTDDDEESEDSETLITDSASRSVETHTAHDSHVQGTSTFRRETETKTPGLKGTQLSARRANAGRNATQLDSSLPDNGQHWFIQQNSGETSSLPDKLYLCTICSLGFARHKDLKEHSYNHKKKYRRYAELLNQIKSKSSITEKDMFQCTHCSTSFTFAADLTKHLKSHEEDRFLASRLEQRRKTKQHRKKKVSTFRENPAPESDKTSRHSSDVTHTCSVCGSVFSSIIALQEHMHHPERPVLETGKKLEMETNIKCMSARADQKQRVPKTSLTNDSKKDKNSGKDNRRTGGERVQKRMNETKQLEGREMPVRTSGEPQSESAHVVVEYWNEDHFTPTKREVKASLDKSHYRTKGQVKTTQNKTLKPFSAAPKSESVVQLPGYSHHSEHRFATVRNDNSKTSVSSDHNGLKAKEKTAFAAFSSAVTREVTRDFDEGGSSFASTTEATSRDTMEGSQEGLRPPKKTTRNVDHTGLECQQPAPRNKSSLLEPRPSDKTFSREPPISDKTFSREACISDKTISREACISDKTFSREPPISDKTISREACISDKTFSREPPISDKTISREVCISDKTFSREVCISDKTFSCEPPISDKTFSREACISDKTISREACISDKTFSREPPISDKTISREACISDKTFSREPPISDKTISREVCISDKTFSREVCISDKTFSCEPPISDKTFSREACISDKTISCEPPISDETISYELRTSDKTIPCEPHTSDKTISCEPPISDKTSSREPRISDKTTSREPRISDKTILCEPRTSDKTISREPCSSDEPFLCKPLPTSDKRLILYKPRISEQPVLCESCPSDKPVLCKPRLGDRAVLCEPCLGDKPISCEPRLSEKQFLCQLCCGSFTTMGELDDHCTALHTESDRLKSSAVFSATDRRLSTIGRSSGKAHSSTFNPKPASATSRKPAVGLIMNICSESDCGASFPSKIGLIAHKSSHKRKSAWTTDVSMEMFDSLSSKTHLRSTSTCRYCSAKFDTTQGLSAHQRVHVKAMPYKCNECTERFQTNGDLKAHKRLHGGCNPFLCPICDASFPTMKGAKIHVAKHEQHNPELQWSCGGSKESPIPLAARLNAAARTSATTLLSGPPAASCVDPPSNAPSRLIDGEEPCVDDVCTVPQISLASETSAADVFPDEPPGVVFAAETVRGNPPSPTSTHAISASESGVLKFRDSQPTISKRRRAAVVHPGHGRSTASPSDALDQDGLPLYGSTEHCLQCSSVPRQHKQRCGRMSEPGIRVTETERTPHDGDVYSNEDGVPADPQVQHVNCVDQSDKDVSPYTRFQGGSGSPDLQYETDDSDTHTAYLCAECGSSFPDKAALEEHLFIWDSLSKPLNCYYCSLSFVCLWALKKHVEGHEDNTNRNGHEKNLTSSLPSHGASGKRTTHFCKLCHCSFANGRDLQLHVDNSHSKTSGSSQTCHLCGKSFTSGKSLWEHRLSHLSAGKREFMLTGRAARPRKAVVAKKEPKTVGGTAERRHKCAFCGAAFLHSSHVKKHTRIHTGERPFVCPDCGAAFTENGALKRHLRVHTRDKPYHCVLCSKAYSDSSSLRRHLQTHPANKPLSN